MGGMIMECLKIYDYIKDSITTIISLVAIYISFLAYSKNDIKKNALNSIVFGRVDIIKDLTNLMLITLGFYIVLFISYYSETTLFNSIYNT